MGPDGHGRGGFDGHHGGFGHHGLVEGSSAFLSTLGGVMLAIALVLLLATVYLLWRRDQLPSRSTPVTRPPEDKARRILAERFARGEIDTEDFMERAAMLNWTPGSDALAVRHPGRR